MFQALPRVTMTRETIMPALNANIIPGNPMQVICSSQSLRCHAIHEFRINNRMYTVCIAMQEGIGSRSELGMDTVVSGFRYTFAKIR